MAALEEPQGVLVKDGQSVTIGPRRSSDGTYSNICHIYQVALLEAYIDMPSEPVVVYLRIDGNEYEFGTLSKNIPIISLAMDVHKESEIFHNSENATAYVWGYNIY